ncbi:DUF480 domain-containing protein [Erwinia sp. E602]|uniref:DUF480 domain-containing protein n=1 Tax=Erwinia sp. E602 TaxID=2675378 RepID=UPI001BA4FB37|nr:DUF480 domain-containing protein [Erwinia sp. E602]QUG77943.1 DUF480 domain-containing protein [Erwinia sp. E602]
MKNPLSAHEARVIGCLLEKQVTTPDQYPMSLNAVVTACNQKSNREPVMALSEGEVQNTLDLLVKKHQVTGLSGFGSRVMKYEQRFCNSEFGQLKLSPGEVALVATLLLRGAQTPGELRTRCQRIHDFADMAEVEQALAQLATRESGALVVRLAREPGKRESRFMHLFSGEVDAAAENDTDTPAALSAGGASLADRVSQLEQQVAALQQQLARLTGNQEQDDE